MTNNSAVTQLFTLVVTLPIFEALPFGTLIGGSVIRTATDLNGNGAMLSAPAGGSTYTALIDGSSVATLLASPAMATAGIFESSVIGPEAVGEPIPSDIGPAAGASIAIQLQFLLRPGDAASFTSIFVVMDIPASAGFVVVLIAAAAPGRRGRR